MRNNILLAICMVGLINCANTEYINQPIVDEGIYKFENGFTLKIEIINGFVKYYLLDQTENILLQPKRNISNFSKWMAIWDGEMLWFSSSDIGDVAWAKDLTGKFQRISLVEIGLLESKIPKIMKEDYYKYKKYREEQKKINDVQKKEFIERMKLKAIEIEKSSSIEVKIN